MSKIAVFPGSFDPITLAHVDIVDRGLLLFDKIVVAVGINTTKKGMFAHEDRLQMISDTFKAYSDRVEVVHFTGLTVDFCQKIGADFILRGMRSINDFESERAIAQNNTELNPQIQTVFLLSEGSKSHISSTIIREILSNKGRVGHLVPAAVVGHVQDQR